MKERKGIVVLKNDEANPLFIISIYHIRLWMTSMQSLKKLKSAMVISKPIGNVHPITWLIIGGVVHILRNHPRVLWKFFDATPIANLRIPDETRIQLINYELVH